ncbi:hypothetical protein EV361DRAFT_868007 [Lentinula raphanica]|nr:hypothetical protein EV361DRAFT_868007 [Lentinula raphanica]
MMRKPCVPICWVLCVNSNSAKAPTKPFNASNVRSYHRMKWFENDSLSKRIALHTKKKAHGFHGYQRTGTESKTHIAEPLYTGKGNRGVEWLSEPQSLIIEWSKAVTRRGNNCDEIDIHLLGLINRDEDTCSKKMQNGMNHVRLEDSEEVSTLGTTVLKVDWVASKDSTFVESITSEFKQASSIAMTDLLNDNSESVTDWSAGWLQSAMMGFGVNSIGVVESRAQLFH